MILLDRTPPSKPVSGQHAPAPIRKQTAIEKATGIFTKAVADGRFVNSRAKDYVRITLAERDEIAQLFMAEGGCQFSHRLSFFVGDFWVSNRNEFRPFCWLNYRKRD